MKVEECMKNDIILNKIGTYVMCLSNPILKIWIFMIVITYRVIASFFSDWLSRKIVKGTYTREIISFLLHFGCGAILQVFGLSSAILFFIIDRLLEKVKIGWLSVIIALSIVVLVFIILINW